MAKLEAEENPETVEMIAVKTFHHLVAARAEASGAGDSNTFRYLPRRCRWIALRKGHA